jgi:hypothetical protein
MFTGWKILPGSEINGQVFQNTWVSFQLKSSQISHRPPEEEELVSISREPYYEVLNNTGAPV